MGILKRTVWCVALLAAAMALSACNADVSGQGMMGGTGWGQHAFRSNGERIYFTATSERGTRIESTGGPSGTGWMMVHGQVACVSCHGVDGRGGRHAMMGSGATMDAKDIRWSALAGEFDVAKFRAAVTEGRDPDGSTLSMDMPRWTIGSDDLGDVISYLKTLP